MLTTLTTGGDMTDQPTARPYLLSDLRRAAGMTQAQMAKRMGVSEKRVSQIEARYPSVRYDTLVSYVQALGGHIQLTVGSLKINIDQIGADAALEGTREWMKSSRRRGAVRLDAMAVFSALPKELPLQGEASDPGGDDSGRDVDHADAEGDQGDGGQGEEA